jgi:hypothetical protein
LRRIVGFVVLGLGVFAVALGLLLKLYAYPRLAKAPLDPKGVSVATGTGVTALVFIEQDDGSGRPEIRNNLSVTATRLVTGDLTQPEVIEDGNVASWIEAVQTIDQDGNLIKATQRQLCLDRHTNEAIEPCTTRDVTTSTSQVNFTGVTDKNVVQPGVNLKFPFDTEKKSYQVFDLTLREATEAKFEAEENLDGLDVYRFVQDIPDRKVESRTIPGSLIGSSEPSVQVDLFYKNKRTMWVEPVTGQIVKGSEEQHQEFVESGDEPGQGTVVLDATLTFNNDTVTKNINDAKDNKAKLWLLTTLPVILWIAGAVFIVGGIALLMIQRRGKDDDGERPSPPDVRELTGATR